MPAMLSWRGSNRKEKKKIFYRYLGNRERCSGEKPGFQNKEYISDRDQKDNERAKDVLARPNKKLIRAENILTRPEEEKAKKQTNVLAMSGGR